MSIADEIRFRVEEGRLFLLPAPTVARPIFVTAAVWQDLHPPWTDEADEIAANELSAVAQFISEGGEVVVGSHTHASCHFKELTTNKPAVWEIRSRLPAPGMRLFGAFAMTDVFVGTNASDRLSLGGANSPRFKAAIRTSRAEWRNLFGNYLPVRGSINDYISKGVTDARIIEEN